MKGIRSAFRAVREHLDRFTWIMLGFATLVAFQWVFIPVWGRYGYWIWAHGGSSSGSW